MLISVILLTVFIGMGMKAKHTSYGIYFDVAVITKVHEGISENLKELMITITSLGSVWSYISLCLVFTIYFLIKKEYIYIFGIINGVLGSAVLNHLVKRYYMRVRPEMFFRIEEKGFSFPSGHSMISFSFYFTLVYILFRNKEWDIRKKLSWVLAGAIVLSVGFSRIYLGVHWPTDIIGGYSLGFIFTYINITIIELIYKKSNA